jgi:hypothetical protein
MGDRLGIPGAVDFCPVFSLSNSLQSTQLPYTYGSRLVVVMAACRSAVVVLLARVASDIGVGVLAGGRVPARASPLVPGHAAVFDRRQVDRWSADVWLHASAYG